MRRIFPLIALLAFSSCVLKPEDTPWEPLALDAPIGMATRAKLSALGGDPQACAARLAGSRLVTKPITDIAAAADCSLDGAVLIERSTIAYGSPVRVSCPMAAALYIWEREVVQPAALAAFGVEVAQIDHLGTYSCRRLYNREEGAFSEHATANAIDVAGFRLSNGQRVTILRDWNGADASAVFLRAVRDGSCKVFNGVLGPEYNEAHRDHLHMDFGRYTICS